MSGQSGFHLSLHHYKRRGAAVKEILRGIRLALRLAAVSGSDRRRLLAGLEAIGAFEEDDGITTEATSRRLLELFDLGVFSDERQFLLWSPVAEESELAPIFERFDSDKGCSAQSQRERTKKTHSYGYVYEAFFGSRRHEIRSVLEVGIGYPTGTLPGDRKLAGGSLRVWREYFPNARIYGGDINEDALFQDDGIWTGQVDQLSTDSIRQFLDEIPDKAFDVIIDDGLHEFEANRVLFEAAVPSLAPEGIYFIEDCQPETREKFRKYFQESPWRVDFFSGLRFNRFRTKDDTIIAVRKAASLNVLNH